MDVVRPAALAIALTALGCGWRSTPAERAQAPTGLAVFESPTEHEVTEGETTLDCDPDVAYATVTDYPKWTAIFPHLGEVVITRRDGADALVTMVGHDGHRDNLHFHNRPATRTLWFEDTGGRAEVWAETTFAPGDRPHTTRVHTRLFADVHGLLSVVVTDANLRDKRRNKVIGDLTELRAFFANSGVASRAR